MQKNSNMEKIHTPSEVAENIKKIIRQQYKGLNEYAMHKNITPTQLYTILNGKEYMSFYSAFRFYADFDLNVEYCTKGTLPMLSPDHEYMALLAAATDFFYAVRDEDRLRDEYELKSGDIAEDEKLRFEKALKKARLEKAKVGCRLVDLLNIGWAEDNPEYDIEKPVVDECDSGNSEQIKIDMKLHEAIVKVLREASTSLTFTEIAKLINRQGLYARKDGKPVPASQISARVKNYPLLFDIDRSVSPIKISISNDNKL